MKDLPRIGVDGGEAILRFLFEDYVLDEARHELRRGAEIVPVEARVFALLTYLIRNRERVVSQEDLRLAVWDGRVVSVSTVSSSMNAARTAIGDNGNDQRFIRTVPRKGFRFVASVIEEQARAEHDVSLAEPGAGTRSAGGDRPLDPEPEARAVRPLPATAAARANALRAAGIFAAGVAAGALVTALLLLWPGFDATRNVSVRQPTAFDASVVPLVDDDTRRILASYPSRPGHKALAIGGMGQFQVADGATSAERAQEAALQGCFTKSQLACQVYAIGDDVVWSDHSMPLPAPRDIRTESLGVPLDPDSIPLISDQDRMTIAERLQARDVSRVLALSTGRYYGQYSATRSEGIRTALERCSFRYGRPCLILAVDGFLTIQIPRTRRIMGTLLPSTDAEIPEADRERIARIYQGGEWRAIARGMDGSWHPVADASSEEAAVAAALKSCALAGNECRLYAIGNFRVAAE